MDGGAWPFLVGGVTCLVNSDNERDLGLLNRRVSAGTRFRLGVGRLYDANAYVAGFALVTSLLRGTVGD